MFNLISNWKISGITTDYAKLSEAAHYLGSNLEELSELTVEGIGVIMRKGSINIEIIAKTMAQFLDSKEKFDYYFDSGIKKYKEEAVIFLVMLSSLLIGLDKKSWVWQDVRHLSQGLYESMEESPAHFLKHNTPIIDEVCEKINTFIRKFQQL